MQAQLTTFCLGPHAQLGRKTETQQPPELRDEWAQGHTSRILAIKEAEAGESHILGQPGLHYKSLSQKKQEGEEEGKTEEKGMGREHSHTVQPAAQPCSLMTAQGISSFLS